MALAPALVGCVEPSVRPIVGPSGSPTLFISCADTGQCYELAGSSCPHGYDIQRARGATVESYLVHCKAEPAPTQQAYYAPAPGAAYPPAQAYSQQQQQQQWAPQPWTAAPPPPPAPPPETAQSTVGAPNAMSLPRPIGSSDFDLGY